MKVSSKQRKKAMKVSSSSLSSIDEEKTVVDSELPAARLNGMLGLEPDTENHESDDLRKLQEMLLSAIAVVADVEQQKLFCLHLACWVMDRQAGWESVARKYKHHLEKVQKFDFNHAPHLLASIRQNTPIEIDLLVSRIDKARKVHMTDPRKTGQGFAPEFVVGRSQGNSHSYAPTTTGQVTKASIPADEDEHGSFSGVGDRAH